MRTTLKDIAEKAGVSQQTVSKVLNNRQFSVSDETRRKILDAAKELNYRPNYFARSLKTGRTGIIGAICGTHGFMGFNDPFLTGILKGITCSCEAHGYKVMTHTFEGLRTLTEELDMANQRMVDGLIFILFSHQVEPFRNEDMPLLEKLNIPYTVVHSLNTDLGCGSVGYDTPAAGKLAVSHLFDHGYDSIGMVLHKDARQVHIEQLFDGYKEAHREKGLLPQDDLVFYADGYGVPAGKALAETMLAEGAPLPRALFCADDYNARGMLAGFETAGTRVPEDIALIGFGDEISDFYIVNRLTSIHQPTDVKGEAAAEMLFRKLENGNSGTSPAFTMFEPELVVRQTCGCSKRI